MSTSSGFNIYVKTEEDKKKINRLVLSFTKKHYSYVEVVVQPYLESYYDYYCYWEASSGYESVREPFEEEKTLIKKIERKLK